MSFETKFTVTAQLKEDPINWDNKMIDDLPTAKNVAQELFDTGKYVCVEIWANEADRLMKRLGKKVNLSQKDLDDYYASLDIEFDKKPELTEDSINTSAVNKAFEGPQEIKYPNVPNFTSKEQTEQWIKQNTPVQDEVTIHRDVTLDGKLNGYVLTSKKISPYTVTSPRLRGCVVQYLGLLQDLKLVKWNRDKNESMKESEDIRILTDEDKEYLRNRLLKDYTPEGVEFLIQTVQRMLKDYIWTTYDDDCRHRRMSNLEEVLSKFSRKRVLWYLTSNDWGGGLLKGKSLGNFRVYEPNTYLGDVEGWVDPNSKLDKNESITEKLDRVIKLAESSLIDMEEVKQEIPKLMEFEWEYWGQMSGEVGGRVDYVYGGITGERDVTEESTAYITLEHPFVKDEDGKYHTIEDRWQISTYWSTEHFEVSMKTKVENIEEVYKFIEEVSEQFDKFELDTLDKEEE